MLTKQSIRNASRSALIAGAMLVFSSMAIAESGLGIGQMCKGNGDCSSHYCVSGLCKSTNSGVSCKHDSYCKSGKCNNGICK